MTIDTAAIKQQIDLRDIIRQDLGEPRKRAAKWTKYLCPFHSESEPSFTVYADGFKCYGCGASGDVIDWMEKYHGQDFQAACQALAGGDLPQTDKPRSAPGPAPKLAEPPPGTWQVRGIQFMVDCNRVLEQRPDMVTWLRDKRGLAYETITAEYIGLNTEDRRYKPSDWEVDDPDVREIWIPRGVIIPHFQGATNTLWGLKVWRGADQKPKYIYVTGSKPDMFGADSLRGHDTAFVTEGEFDCLLLSQFVGDLAGVVTFGGASTHEVEAWLPYLLPCKRLLICTDNDQAGGEAWEYWRDKTQRAERILPPGGVKDITDAWKAGHDLKAWALEVLEGSKGSS